MGVFNVELMRSPMNWIFLGFCMFLLMLASKAIFKDKN